MELDQDYGSGLRDVALVDDPNGLPTPPRLSPSGASTYEQCPRRWRFRYVDRLPDPPGEAAIAGSFAHRVLELLLQRDPAGRTVDAAKVIAREVWPEFENDPDFQALELDDNTARAFRWKGWKAIAGLWAIEDPAAVAVEATEHDLKVDLDGVPFRGIVDRLDVEPDGLVVTDYKSGKAPSPRYSGARLAQVLLYAAAVQEATGVMPVRARLLYLGQKIIDIAVTEGDIARVVGELSDTWNAINTSCQSDVFEPRTGPLCGWCPYADKCPEGTKAVLERNAAQARRDQAYESVAS